MGTGERQIVLLGHIDTVYDRAALTALPEDIRKHYVAQLRLIVPVTTNVILLTIEDMEENETTQQGHRVDKEITSLYAEDFEISLAHVEVSFELDPKSPNQPPIRTDYKVYRLSNR